MKNLKCPERIEDVKPEHREWICINILGWTFEETKSEKNYFDKNSSFQGGKIHIPNFFTNIQHSKMLDEFLFKNGLIIEMRTFYMNGKMYYVYDVLGEDKNAKMMYAGAIKFPLYKLKGGETSDSEAFARTSAIWKAKEALEK